MAIQQLLVDVTADFISNYVRGAVITIDGVDVDYPIYKTIRDGNKIKKLVYIQSEEGLVTDAIIVDANGRELQTKVIDITKNEVGLVIAFVIEIKIEGA